MLFRSRQLQDTIDKVSDIMKHSTVLTVVEFVDSLIGDISTRIVSLKFLILLVVIIIIVLVVVLMQKMFLLKERGQISLLKAIGFNNAAIIKWQTKRIAVVLISGMILGLITMLPFSHLTSGEVFKLMGASHIDFVINSQVLWGDYDTIDDLSICELIRPRNSSVVTVERYRWNGKYKEIINNRKEYNQELENA